MKGVKVYQPIGKSGFITPFLEGLEPKLREKLVWRIYFLSHTPLEELKEPHYKHFSIERYKIGRASCRERV